MKFLAISSKKKNNSLSFIIKTELINVQQDIHYLTPIMLKIGTITEWTFNWNLWRDITGTRDQMSQAK